MRDASAMCLGGALDAFGSSEHIRQLLNAVQQDTVTKTLQMHLSNPFGN